MRWSLRQIRIKLFESLLIILGIGLGVAVICSVVGLVQNFSQQFIMTNNLRQYQLIPSEISYGTSQNSAAPLHEIGPVKTAKTFLTIDDYLDLREVQLDGLKEVWISTNYGELKPGVDWKELQTTSGKQVDFEAQRKWEEVNVYKICLASPEVFDIAKLKLVKGDLFRLSDLKNKSKVVVIGDNFAAKNFKGQNPIGQKIRLQQGEYTVIGVVHHAFADGEKDEYIQGIDSRGQLNNLLYMPYSSYALFSGDKEGIVNNIFMQATEDVKPALFYARLNKFIADKYQGGVSVMSDYLSNQEAKRSYIRIGQVMGLFACGALLIAAINILNLMTARVLRRYKQIGISMALGASKRDIFKLFLAEAGLLGFLGSIIGIVLAFGGMQLLGKLVYQKLPITFWTLIIGIGSAFLTSLIFGFYPAKQAAGTPPVDALKKD